MTEPDVAAIVAGLSEGAKQWLLHPGYVDPNTMRAIRRRGLIKQGQRGLSDLGLAVRAALSGGRA